MNTVYQRARERFAYMKARPVMCARYKEAFLAEVTGVMCVLYPAFDPTGFIKQHCRTDPLDAEVDTVWCAAVIDGALRCMDALDETGARS